MVTKLEFESLKDTITQLSEMITGKLNKIDNSLTSFEERFVIFDRLEGSVKTIEDKVISMENAFLNFESELRADIDSTNLTLTLQNESIILFGREI